MASSFLDVKDILNDYCEEIQDGLIAEAQKQSKGAKDELRQISPVNKTNSKTKGDYRKGWVVSTKKSNGAIHCVVHNKTNWQLTHLLENPHAIRNQYGSYGTSKPKVHITPVADKYAKEFEQAVQNLIRSTK